MYNSLTDLSKQQIEFNSVYRGTVVDNNDPLSGFRIRVKVYPMMIGFNDADLPWAVPSYPIITGSIENTGWVCVPEIGSNVWIMFEEGKISKPMYFGEAFSPSRKPSEADNINKKVFKFKSGTKIVINENDGSLLIKVKGKIDILVDGTANVKSVGSMRLESDNDVTIKGSMIDILVDGTANVKSVGNLIVQSDNNITIKGSKVSINP